MNVILAQLSFIVLAGQCNAFLFDGFGNSRCAFRDWGKCSIDANGEITRQREPTTSSRNCLPETGRCSVGTLLGDSFIDNLLQPVTPATPVALAPQDGRVPPASNRRVGWGSRRRRRFRNPASTGTTSPQQNCIETRDRNGNLIMGNCNTRAQRQQTRRKRSLNDTPTSQQANRDLLIMLDESGSVGENKFQKLKRIGAAIVKLLCKEIAVHRDKTRVSVMSFDEENHFHVALNRYFPHEDDLSAFIKNIRVHHCLIHKLLAVVTTNIPEEVASADADQRKPMNDVEPDLSSTSNEMSPTPILRRSGRERRPPDRYGEPIVYS